MKRLSLLLLLVLLLALPALALAQEATPEATPEPTLTPAPEPTTEVRFVGIEMPEWYTNAFSLFSALVPVLVAILAVSGIVLPTVFFRALLTLAKLTSTEADDEAIIEWAIQAGYTVTFDEHGNIIIVDGREETPTSSFSTRN
jgi:hypothetical protein